MRQYAKHCRKSVKFILDPSTITGEIKHAGKHNNNLS